MTARLDPWELSPEPAPTPKPRGNLLWCAVDLDGTIAEGVWRADNPVSTVGAPRKENILKLLDLWLVGWKIVIHTARPWTDYEAIEVWLNHHKIPFDKIICGKLLAAIYVDDRARYSEDAHWNPR